jgi:hypothetical protein
VVGISFKNAEKIPKNMKQNRKHLKDQDTQRNNKLRNMSHREEQHRKKLGSSSS